MKIKDIHFDGFNSHKLFARIYIPDTSERLPGILLCHGYKTDHREFAMFPLELSENGFVVMTFDYSGNGRSEGMSTLVTAKSHQIDTECALNELQKENITSTGILGHSLGTHMALYSLVYNRDVKAGVLVAPMRRGGENLGIMQKCCLYSAGFFYLLLGGLPVDIYLANPTKYDELLEDKDALRKLEQEDIYPQTCNLRYSAYSITINDANLAKRNKKPTLVAIAQRDKVIKPKVSMDVFNKIASQDKELLLLENSGHSAFRDYDKDALLTGIVRFFKKYL